MNNENVRAALHNLAMTCDINERYHQILAWRWGLADKIVKIFVAVLAVLALVTAFLDEHWKSVEIGFALAAAVVAVALNVVPLGEYEKTYERLFIGWSKLHRCIDNLQLKTDDNTSKAPAHAVEQLVEMQSEMNLLHADEPAPYRGLLEKCQGDSNQSIWGPGIRTNEQVEEARASIERSNAEVTSSASAAGQG